MVVFHVHGMFLRPPAATLQLVLAVLTGLTPIVKALDLAFLATMLIKVVSGVTKSAKKLAPVMGRYLLHVKILCGLLKIVLFAAWSLSQRHRVSLS